MMCFLSPLNAKSLLGYILLLCLVFTFVPFSGTVQAAAFQVNSADDTNDGNCNAHCSLREAINAANNLAGTDIITFNIPGGDIQTIQPTTTLPAITSPVIIDGATQPGYSVGAPVIELDGTNAGLSADGLVLAGGGSTVRGLIINRFKSNGILITTNGGNTIVGNFIGTDATGTLARPNGFGIRIAQNNNIIGGTDSGAGNVISGNQAAALDIYGSGNTIQGNYIGTDITGTLDLGNGFIGISIMGDGFNASANNLIGGTVPGAGNIIAYNAEFGPGIGINGTTSTVGNAILGNSIFDNGSLGIDIGPEGFTANDVGDADIGVNNRQNFPVLSSVNWVSGNLRINGALNSTANTLFRIEFFASPACDSGGNGEGQTYLGFAAATTNGSGNATFSADLAPGGTLPAQVITATATDPANNTSEFSGCSVVPIVPPPAQSGPIFTVNTAADVDDGVCGIAVCSLREAINAANALPDANTIEFDIGAGGLQTIQPTTPLPWVTQPAIIDGTTQLGYAVGAPVVVINGANAVSSYPPGNQIDLVGINIVSASNNTVRGLVLNGWNYGGVGILNGSNNVIEGNFIGTNQTGTTAVPNLYGVIIYNGSNNRVGGTTPAQRNIISGNNDDSVNIGGQTSAQAVANLVQGNYIGTNAAGTAALGNGDDGVKVEIADGTIIGGTTAGTRNIISASNNNGVILKGANTVNSVVQGNFIGTDVTGTIDLGNNLYGVFVEESPGNTIGGVAVETGNRIAFSVNTGVNVTGTTAIDNAILGNAIFANGNLGIDLGSNGITANDLGDVDTGANGLQNFPVLSSGGVFGAGTTVNGTLNSQPNQTHRLEFFANAACDPSGYGEGQTYLGFTDVTTNGSGDVNFTVNLAAVTSVGQFISATATDPNNNTSEFSACIPVVVISAPVAAPSRNYYANPSVLLSWDGVSWAIGYEIEVDSNADFLSPEYADPSVPASVQSDTTLPLEDGVYYWRVGAKKPGGGIVWSTVEIFIVDVP